MRTAVLLRQALIPYIYNNAHTAYEQGQCSCMCARHSLKAGPVLAGLSLIRPMYYEFPLDDNAYTYEGQVEFSYIEYYGVKFKQNNCFRGLSLGKGS